MIFSEFKDKLLTVMPGREMLPEDTALSEVIHRALKKIAKQTVPLWLRTSETNSSILRKIDNATYIRFPFHPLSQDDDIDIDEALLDAVAYHVASELEPQKKGAHLNMYDKEITMNNERLIETDLDVCLDMISGSRGSAWV